MRKEEAIKKATTMSNKSLVENLVSYSMIEQSEIDKGFSSRDTTQIVDILMSEVLKRMA